MFRGATAEIDLDAISHNLRVVREITDNRPVIAVVKADAYGHGAVEISTRLVNEGVALLAVAYTGEAITLRDAGIRSDILVLFDKYDIPIFFNYRLTPVVHDMGTAKRFSEEAKRRNCPLDVHVKIDTGMGRLGLSSGNVLDDVLAVSEMGCLNITGLMSHFSDSDSLDRSFAERQLEKFVELRKGLVQKQGRKKIICHVANSAAILAFPEAHLDAVRPGLMLYGYSPCSHNPSISPLVKGSEGGSVNSLKPSMKVKTRILSLRKLPEGTPVSYGRTFVTRRESLVAVLPVGYADGYSRALSNNAHVLIGGKRAPVVGRVCMDLTMVDVTEIEDVEEDDEVVLLGSQGKEEVAAKEIAVKAGTIAYEILTSLGSRSTRIYAGKDRA